MEIDMTSKGGFSQTLFWRTLAHLIVFEFLQNNCRMNMHVHILNLASVERLSSYKKVALLFPTRGDIVTKRTYLPTMPVLSLHTYYAPTGINYVNKEEILL